MVYPVYVILSCYRRISFGSIWYSCISKTHS